MKFSRAVAQWSFRFSLPMLILGGFAASVTSAKADPLNPNDRNRSRAAVVVGEPGEFSRQSVELSRLEVDDSGRLAVPILNRTDYDVHILDLSSSCSCTATAVQDKVIAPQSESQIWLQIGDQTASNSQRQWMRIEYGINHEKHATLVYLIDQEPRRQLESTVISSSLNDEGQVQAVVRIDSLDGELIAFAPQSFHSGTNKRHAYESFVVLPIHINSDAEGRFRRRIPLGIETDKGERIRLDLPTEELLLAAGVEKPFERMKARFLYPTTPEITLGEISHGQAIQFELVVPSWERGCDPILALDPPRASVGLLKTDYDEVGATFTIAVTADVVRRGVLQSSLVLRCGHSLKSRVLLTGRIVRAQN